MDQVVCLLLKEEAQLTCPASFSTTLEPASVTSPETQDTDSPNPKVDTWN